MAEVTVTVCDECKALDKPTRKYGISTPELAVDIELCSTHARPLDRLVSLAAGVAAGVAAAPVRRRGRKRALEVRTVEEIERSKES